MRRLLALAMAFLAAGLGCGPRRDGDSPHKVYAMLGFHSNFYHSWRGDSADEAGFGTDIRLARFILDELDRAQREGLDARGYWDHDNLFTLETILPAYAPDIPRRIRERVREGQDEVVLGAYANGLTGAMTRNELAATLEWAVHNPWGSGTRDVFGTYTPVFRPQEGMLSTGAIPILQAAGVEAVVLAYSEWPFDAFANFVPRLAPEQRYGVTWLRLRADGPRIKLLPAMSIGDVLNHVSFERWLLDLRELQLSGEVDQDLVLHMNFDTDVESWVPQELPAGLGWFPNAGGLREYIEAVNAHPWAEFITPGELLARLEPVGEVVIRRDTADGSFDGHASWAEKLPSHVTWTDLEGSRLAGERAEAWLRTLGPGGAARAQPGLALADRSRSGSGLRSASGQLGHWAPATPPSAQLAERFRCERCASADSRVGLLATELRERLWEGRDSSFFQRLRGLSTTHFGMSTPVLNEERQAVARQVAASARRRAEETERAAAEAAEEALGVEPLPPATLARIDVADLRERGAAGAPARSLLRLPFVFADGALPATRLVDSSGRTISHAWLNRERLGTALAAELWVLLELGPGEMRRLTLERSGVAAAVRRASDLRLANASLVLELGASGIESLRRGDWQVGGPDFLAPFLSYRVGPDGGEPRTFHAAEFTREPLEGERPDGFARARLATRIPFETPEGEAAARLRVDLTLPEAAPWIVADVDVEYPYTAKRDLLHTAQQKLRRYLDLRWIEVGPFPLTPRLEGSRDAPLSVWKHDFLGVTASFPLDYARINPRNAELDAFNHQITAGWVAVSDGRHGLLVADSTDVLTSFAFAPMRLRERDGGQVLSLNPFGTYHGRQLAYDHLGGNGVGTEFTTLGSSAVRPNGPSYNGARERFSLLLAPYTGDAPPQQLRADAAAFFHPPAVVVVTPEGRLLPRDLRARREALRLAERRRRRGPLPPPRAFLANPGPESVDLVWDAPADPRLTGYEIAWRRPGEASWQSRRVDPGDRAHLGGLADGERYLFRIRSRAGDEVSPWSPETAVEVGPVAQVDPKGAAADAPLGLLLRTFWYGLVHAVTTG